MKDRLSALQEFLEKDPSDSFTRYALALEHLSRGDHAAGIALLMETLERDPAYIPAYQQIGQALHRDGATDEAIAWYTRGIAEARERGERHAADEMTQELDDIRDEL